MIPFLSFTVSLLDMLLHVCIQMWFFICVIFACSILQMLQYVLPRMGWQLAQRKVKMWDYAVRWLPTLQQFDLTGSSMALVTVRMSSRMEKCSLMGMFQDFSTLLRLTPTLERFYAGRITTLGDKYNHVSFTLLPQVSIIKTSGERIICTGVVFLSFCCSWSTQQTKLL